MDGLRVERVEGVVTATLDRPHVRNALDAPLFEALRALFVEVAERDDDRAVVLTGAGDTFCAGGDLRPTSPSGDDPATVLRRFGRTVQAMHDCPKPILAAVDGAAAGAGMSLALACDLAVASDRARFALLFVRHGLSLDCGASWHLTRCVGDRRAKELALLGDWVDAPTAERYGLVNRVVPAAELGATAHEWAGRLAASPPVAVQWIKRTLDEHRGVTLAEALEREAVAQAASVASPETQARIEQLRRRR